MSLVHILHLEGDITQQYSSVAEAYDRTRAQHIIVNSSLLAEQDPRHGCGRFQINYALQHGNMRRFQRGRYRTLVENIKAPEFTPSWTSLIDRAYLHITNPQCALYTFNSRG